MHSGCPKCEFSSRVRRRAPSRVSSPPHEDREPRGCWRPMRLTAWEEERLLIFPAAELARRHRSAGLKLNHPEVVALICDAMLEAARAGGSFEAVEAAGRAAVGRDEVLPGVAALVDEVRLEVLLEDGTRLVVLRDPVAASGGAGAVDQPGASDPAGEVGRADSPDRVR